MQYINFYIDWYLVPDDLYGLKLRIPVIETITMGSEKGLQNKKGNKLCSVIHKLLKNHKICLFTTFGSTKDLNN